MENNKINAHITFMELRSLVSSQKIVKTPTPKYLRENDTPVAISEDGSTIAYSCGYVFYRSAAGNVVVSLDECRNYTYRFIDGDNISHSTSIISSEMIDKMEWQVAVALTAEDRADKNSGNRKGNRDEYRYDLNYDEFDPWERIELEQYVPDILTEIIEEENIEDLLNCLTEKQREVVRNYFFKEMTQKEIAEKLGIAQRVVSHHLDAALTKLRKNKSE